MESSSLPPPATPRKPRAWRHATESDWPTCAISREVSLPASLSRRIDRRRRRQPTGRRSLIEDAANREPHSLQRTFFYAVVAEDSAARHWPACAGCRNIIGSAKTSRSASSVSDSIEIRL